MEEKMVPKVIPRKEAGGWSEARRRHIPGLFCPNTEVFEVQGTLKSLLQCHSSKASIPWC